MPKPNPGESKEDYITRFMGSKEAKRSHPDEKQRLAVAHSYWKKHHKEMGSINFNYNVAIEEMGMVDSDFIIAGTAINATVTSNNHKFLPEVLEESAKTLIGVPLLVDHENKVENIKGRVFYAGYDASNQRVPFKAKVMDSEIKSMIKDGRLNSVSVGAMVNPKDIEEDSEGCLIPHNIVFKELSLVAVPADQGATFNIAMNQAYKSFKEDDDVDIDDLEPDMDEQMSDDEMRKMMKKKGMSDEEIEKAIKMRKAKGMDQSQIKSDSSINERRENMEENKTEIVEEKKEVVDKSAELIKAMSEKMEAMAKEISEMKAKAEVKEKPVVAEKKEEKAEVEEVEEESQSDYKILQGVGSLKGGSFTMIKNKY